MHFWMKSQRFCSFPALLYIKYISISYKTVNLDSERRSETRRDIFYCGAEQTKSLF